jgi:hypothetical protein
MTFFNLSTEIKHTLLPLLMILQWMFTLTLCFSLSVLSFVILFALGSSNQEGVSESNITSGGGDTPAGGDGDDPDDNERRRRLVKKILIGLGVIIGVGATCCGLSYLLCEGDPFAFLKDPKAFWNSLGGALGVVTVATTTPEMVTYLNGIWEDMFEHITTAEILSPILGDLEFPSQLAMHSMMEEILQISQKNMIRLVLQAHPDGATHYMLQTSLEKALTCEIQTIALKYAIPVD